MAKSGPNSIATAVSVEDRANSLGPGGIDYDELPTYLGYLVRRAHSHIQTEFEGDLADVGMATSAFGILTLIRANPGITANELAQASRLDKSTLSPMIVNLETAGLITRKQRTSDRRYQSLFLAKGAESNFMRYRDKIRTFETKVANRLTKSEQSHLAKLLIKLQGLDNPTPDHQEDI